MTETPLLVALPSVPPDPDPPPDPPEEPTYVVLLQDVEPGYRRGQVLGLSEAQADAMIAAESARAATDADIAIAYPNILIISE
jgi:hypothetical protein